MKPVCSNLHNKIQVKFYDSYLPMWFNKIFRVVFEPHRHNRAHRLTHRKKHLSPRLARKASLKFYVKPYVLCAHACQRAGMWFHVVFRIAKAINKGYGLHGKGSKTCNA